MRIVLVALLALALGLFFSPAWADIPTSTRVDAAERQRLGLALDAALQARRADDGHPSLALIVFDDTGVIWAGAAGHADFARQRPATVDGVYRAGSISKLFTDIMIMQQVDRGVLELDAPVERYLPEFRPQSRWATPITVRMLMTHRSGLVREPPVGSYFEPGDPGHAALVESLNGTSLVAEPGTLTKYSNAGVAVLGALLERVTGKTYDALVAEGLFVPLDMDDSGFRVAAAGDRLVQAELTPLGSPRALAPVFDMGLTAAGTLNTTLDDLALFGRALLNGGRGDAGPILSGPSLALMQEPEADGFGLGFTLSEVEGNRAIGHGGAIYGYTAELKVLPEAGLGVVAFGTVDGGAAPFVLGQYALEAALASRAGTTLPSPPARAEPVPIELAGRAQGLYGDGNETIRLRAIDGRLMVEAPTGAGEARLREGRVVLDTDVIFTGTLDFSPAFDALTLNGRTFRRVVETEPAPPSADLAGLIGVYRLGAGPVVIYERDGFPHINIELFSYERMIVVDRDTLAFGPDSVLYPHEQIRFSRDAQGGGTSLSLGGIVFQRTDLDAAATPPATPERAAEIDRLRDAALLATPPAQPAGLATPDLVNVQDVDPAIKLDVRYATASNFVGVPVYRRPVAMMQRPAAEALKRANARLRADGLGLVMHDGYRPWYVTKVFWDLTPEDQKIFVADPADGSRHNRGMAADVGLYDLATGAILDVGAGYDEATDRSYATFVGGSSLQRWRRERLRAAMEAEGYALYPFEWWHFDFQGWRNYPVLNLEIDR